MSGKLNKPHDVFMKFLLGDIDLARDFLLQFLPAEIREQLDFSTLAHDKSTFVTPALKEAFTDSVFSVKLWKGGDKECLISILIEHKSYADDRAAFQILHYLAQGYHQQLKELSHQRKEVKPMQGAPM
jgi:predicted transposase/invertase (TIGR01784 family)